MKVLIIGQGSIGKRHKEILESLGCEISIVSQHTQTPYRSLTEVEDLEQFELFIIASETYKHFDDLVYIDTKVSNKTILVEKPLFEKYRCYENVNNSIYIAYNLRFHPIIKWLKTHIKVKDVISVNIKCGQYLPEWRTDRDYRDSYSSYKDRGGGVLLDLSHEIDYAIWLFGQLSINFSLNKKISDLSIDSDDYSLIVATNKFDAVVNIELDYISKVPYRKIIINTLSKTIVANLINSQLVVTDKGGKKEELSFDTQKNSTYIEMHNQLIDKNYINICSFSEGMNIMKMIGQIFSEK